MALSNTSSKCRIWVDGCVFEHNGNIGIWRVFYEILSRISDQADITLWLRSRAVLAVPPGVRVVRDTGRFYGPRWDPLSRIGRFVSKRLRPAGLRDADVYHSTYFTHCPSPGPAIVTTVHDMIAERLYSISGGWAEPHIPQKSAAIRAADLCISVSHATSADLVRFFPETDGRIRTIHHGYEHLDTFEFDAAAPIGQAFALFVGQRDGHKNFRVVLDAMGTTSWPKGLVLHVVGPAFARHERQLIKALGLDGAVVERGRLSDGALRAEYASARCFIYPSLLEGFGLPVLEAQLCRCPAVLSDTPVFRETAGQAALFFDPRLENDLARTVCLACEPESRKALVESGLENLRRFSWDRAAKQTLAAYHEAADQKSKV